MKMLCIRGRTHRAHTGLFAGRVYEVSIVKYCCAETRALAEGSVFLRGVSLRCKTCGKVERNPKQVPWCPSRFIPFDPDELGVTEDESNELYQPKIPEREVS